MHSINPPWRHPPPPPKVYALDTKNGVEFSIVSGAGPRTCYQSSIISIRVLKNVLAAT